MDVSPVALETVIEVVNGWSTTVRAESGEASAPYPDLAELLPAGRDLAAPPDQQLAAMAQRLFAVFSTPTTARRLEALNAAIRQIDPTPVASVAGPRWAVAKPQHALEAALLLSLAEHAREDRRLERLGTCEADRCCDVYMDATRAETRKYCSPKCQNRTKVAQHRRRQRAATPQR